MKKLILLGFVCLALMLVPLPFAACAEEAPTPAAPAAAPAEPVYTVLDPRGFEPEREFQAISPRLDTLEGKKVGVVCLHGGNSELCMPSIAPSIMALVPECNAVYYFAEAEWHQKRTEADWEFIESCDAVILGHDFWGNSSLNQGKLLVEVEKKGIPGLLESWDTPDMTRIAKDAFRMNGVPACRQVFTTPDTGITDLSEYAQDFIDALTVPRTEEEAASGIFTPPTPARILMTGTYDEVQAYFEGDLSRFPAHVPPHAWLTDGSCITPPTEERVAEMLKGTSHAPDEIVRENYKPKELWCTVEKVAINAVMAGCKPEYMPVALTLAESGCCCSYPGDSSAGSSWVVSGPIAKEIGMNSWFCYLAPGNPANTSLSRCATMMGINLGGLEMGMTNPNRTGNNIWSLIYAEATDESPWCGLNENAGFEADQSVLVPLGSALVPYNTMAMVSPHTLWELQVSTPEIVVGALQNGGSMVQFCPQTAWIWHDEYGFETMQELKDYIWDNVTWTVGELKANYWQYIKVPQIAARERGTPRMLNPDHLDLPDDALIPKITSPDSISIVVAGGNGDCWSWGSGGRGKAMLIDKWR